MCGEVKSKKDDKSVSTPLVTISDLQKMKMFEVIVRRVRLAPFKTKLTPDFKMNWGRTYPKVDIFNAPERVRRPLETFDVREFVKAKRKEKMDNLLGSPDSTGGALPFFPGMPGMNNPFASNNNSMFPNPMMDSGMKQETKEPFDVDAIVKKIDEQIAKIEEEERRLKNEGNISDKKDDNDINLDKVINNKDLQKENNERIEELFKEDDNRKVTQELPNDININVPSNETRVDNNISSDLDDDYLDDFWD